MHSVWGLGGCAANCRSRRNNGFDTLFGEYYTATVFFVK